MKMLMFIVIKVCVFMAIGISAVVAENHSKQDITYKKIQVSSQIIMLQGKGGNIGVITGEDGLLIIDDQYKVNVDALKKSLGKMSGLPEFIVNTHWHGDHTGGNTLLGKTATIIAHTNVRKRLNSPQEIKFFNAKFDIQPKSALPVITFDDSLSIHFNNLELNVVHYASGHTDGDSVVFIKSENVVHMGDYYFSGMFPFVDLGSGGDVKILASNVKKIIDILPKDVKIIPGHGPLSTLDELKGYHKMLLLSISVVQKYIDKGLALKQVQEKGLPVSLKMWGNGFVKEKNWIGIVYASLKS